MIPYFQIPSLHFFGFSIHAFEILTSLGIFLAIQCAIKMGERRNLTAKYVIDAILISIFFGFLGAHWMHVLLYQRNFSNPILLLEPWKGISSTGGFLIGALACWIYLRIKKLSVKLYGDCLVAGLLIGEFFGRLGCTTVHDHPGKLTSFFLAVQFPDGIRFDMGMLEAILLGLFLLVIYATRFHHWLDRKPGRWIAMTTIYYGSIRFSLDFLRAQDLPDSDPRYMGLTPAQYVCFIFVILGFSLIGRSHERKTSDAHDRKSSS